MMKFRKIFTLFVVIAFILGMVPTASAYQEAGANINIALNKKVVATSEMSGELAANMVVDGNYNTIWSCAVNEPKQNVTIDLETPTRLSKIVVTFRQEVYQPEVMNHWEIRGSNDPDFSTYSILGSWGGDLMPMGFSWNVSITDEGKYRYVRVTRNVNQYSVLAEVEIYPYVEGEMTDINDEDYELAAQVLTDMKLFEKENGFNPNRTITKKEVLKAIMGALKLTGDSTKDPYFLDINKEDALYPLVQQACELNIIAHGDKYFGGDKFITKEEVLKMMLEALGYGVYMDEQINKSVVEVARIADFSVDAISQYVSRGEFALLLYNMLNTPRLECSAYRTEDRYSYEKGEKPFKTIYGYAQGEGIISGRKRVNAQSEGRVIIDGKEYRADEKTYNRFGYKVEFLYDIEDNRILASKKSKHNNYIVIDAEDLRVTDVNYRKNIIDYKVSNEKSKFATLDTQAVIMYNGVIDNDSRARDFVFDEGNVTLIDSNNDNRYDYVLINAGITDVVEVSSKNENSFKLKTFTGAYYEFNLQNSCAYLYSETGAELLDLSTNDVINIYKAKDNSLVSVYASETELIGELDEVRKDEVVIDGVAYELSDYLAGSIGKPLIVGETYTFILSPNNKVAWYLEDRKGSYEYGFFGAAISDVFGDGEIKIYTKEGKFKIFKMASKMILDGVSVSSHSSITSLTPQLIRYYLNAAGEVRKIDSQSVGTRTEDDKLDGTVQDLKLNANSIDYLSSMKAFINHSQYSCRVDDNTKILYVPRYSNGTIAIDKEDSWRIESIPTTSKEYRVDYNVMFAYNVDELKYTDFIIIYEEVGDSSSSSYRICSGRRGSSMVVTGTGLCFANGETGVYIEGYDIDKKEKVKITLDRSYNAVDVYKLRHDSSPLFDAYNQIANPGGIDEKYKFELTDIAVGDIVSYKEDASGTVTEFQRDFDVSKRPYTSPTSYGAWFGTYNLFNQIHANYRLLYSVVYRNKGTITCLGNEVVTSGALNEEIYDLGNVPVYIFTEGADTIEKGDYMDILANSYENNPDARIMLMQVSAEVKAVVVYKYTSPLVP